MVTTVASGTMMGFGVFITPMAEDMGWSHSALSFSYALSAMVTGIGVLIVGSFLHTHSVRFIFFLSTLVHCFGIYMTSTATTNRSGPQGKDAPVQLEVASVAPVSG